MSNTIRIKRRSSGAPGAPSVLANSELAFNEVDKTLWIGIGTGGANGTATTVEAIGGFGAYVSLSGTQTITGDKTFSGNISLGSNATATTPATSDNDTSVATTAFVKAQGYLTSSTGVTSVALSLPNIFSVSGSPVTTTGTLSASFTSQTANTVFAAPNGSAGTPGFRALVAGDIPTLTASKISDFDTQVRTSRLDQMAAPTAAVSLNSQQIKNLADPTQAQDAATKAYVDATKQGLDVKDSVRAATTANITLSGAQTIDGVALSVGDRVLVKNQNTGSQNGIYEVKSSTWSRAADADTSAKVTAGLFVFVEEGTANADSGFVLTTNGSITLGTTAIAFTQFSGAGQITAGGGLTKTGNTLDVVGTADRITVNADSIDIASTYVGQASITTLGTITSGTWTGTTIAIANGGTGATSASAARTSLGLQIGLDVQAYDAELSTLAGMSSAAATSLAALSGTEAAVIDGSTSASATTLAATDNFVVNDNGTMVQVALSNLVAFLEDGATSSFDIDGGEF